MIIIRLSSRIKIFNDRSKMYIKAFKSSGFREEFTHQKYKMLNENNLYMNKENTKKISKKKIEKRILYGLPRFL